MANIGELQESREKQTRQFSLIDVFAAMTFVAVLCAVCSPLFRALGSETQAHLILPMAVQACLILGGCAYAIRGRRKLVATAGRRIGVAFCGTAKWRHWPVFKCALLLVGMAMAQVSIAIAIAQSGGEMFMIMLNAAQITFMFAQYLVNFLWRVYPGTIEFFENGVVVGGNLTRWSNVDVRASQFYDDRIAIVLKPNGTMGMDTKMARVSESLRGRVFDVAKSFGEAESSLPLAQVQG